MLLDRAARDPPCCSTPLRRDQVWDQMPAGAGRRSSTAARSCGSIDAESDQPPRERASASGSTPSCRPASSPSPELLPTDDAAIEAIKDFDRQELRQARRVGRPSQPRRRRSPHSPGLDEVRSRRRHRTAASRPRPFADAPEFFQRCHRTMLAGEGDPTAGECLHSRSTARSRPVRAGTRSAPSRPRSRSGMPTSASTALGVPWRAHTPRSA
jgi:hypothetical protein